MSGFGGKADIDQHGDDVAFDQTRKWFSRFAPRKCRVRLSLISIK